MAYLVDSFTGSARFVCRTWNLSLSNFGHTSRIKKRITFADAENEKLLKESIETNHQLFIPNEKREKRRQKRYFIIRNSHKHKDKNRNKRFAFACHALSCGFVFNYL